MDNQTNIIELISSSLDTGKYKEALYVSNSSNFAKNFKNCCSELIPVLISKIQDDTIIIKPSLYGVCEQLLNIVVEKAAPEVALLEFIEQTEIAKNDAQFSIILNSLQQLLKKLTRKRGRSLEWCLNSITTYIETIPTPEYQLEDKERLLMDCDGNIRRILKVYSMIPPFYKPFIEEISNDDSNIRTKQIICAFLISLLGKPILYIDLDPETNSQSEARQVCSTIIEDICTLEKNVLKFLTYVEQHSRETSSKYKDLEDNMSPYNKKDHINVTSLSGLFYVVFSGHFNIIDNAIPQVYNNEYIVHTGLLTVNNLLCYTEYGPQHKALILCKSLLNRYPNNVSQIVLSLSVHFNLLKNLINTAIFSNYNLIRRSSVNLISIYINKFEFKGRCLLIKYILENANHSGMIGYGITLYKNSITEAFNNPVLDDCFTGTQIMVMIKKICLLSHGAETDLVELADQIITALNLLRYLIIRDKLNKTGIKDHFEYIQQEYLQVLRNGLNLSKAHYEVKLKDVKENKSKKRDKIEVSINIGGNVFDDIPAENKEEIINSALNALHLIEGLVARLSECINAAETIVNN